MDVKKAPRGIGKFFREIWAELKRVAWPSRHELWIYTIAVIVTVFIVATILTIFDVALAKALVQPLFRR